MDGQHDFLTCSLENAWKKMLAGIEQTETVDLRQPQAEILDQMRQCIGEPTGSNELVMGIKDVKLGHFTVDIVALSGLVLSTLSNVLQGEGSTLQMILSMAVFVSSLIGTISIADEQELSDEQLVYSCILTLHEQKKASSEAITVDDVVKSVQLLDGCNRLKKKIPVPINVNAALEKLKASNRIWVKGRTILVEELLLIDRA